MEKILSLFRRRQEETEESGLDSNQYYNWNSPFDSEAADHYYVWHTEYGFDRERNLNAVYDNTINVSVVQELPDTNGDNVVIGQQPSASTEPTGNDHGDVNTTETFTYSQFGTEGTEDDEEKIPIPKYTRILLILGLVVCKPFGQIMFDNYLLSIYFRYHGEKDEAARRFRLACIWGVITYVSFILYMASLAAIIVFSI